MVCLVGMVLCGEPVTIVVFVVKVVVGNVVEVGPLFFQWWLCWWG